MSKQPSRAQLQDDVARAAERFGAAADAVDEAAAAVFGVNRTDLRIIGALAQREQLSAGAVAAAVGLSPAATTIAIQRLVAAGHLVRETDEADRRRAVVALTPAAAELVDRVYGPIAAAGRRILHRYTLAELTAIADFLRRGEQLQRAHAERLLAARHPTTAAAQTAPAPDSATMRRWPGC